MKIAVNISRVLVGALFIFSGLVKAIDPLGLAYKMQEFFEVWAAEGIMKNMMLWLNEHALWFSVIMIALEVILGVAVLLGWKIKAVSWTLLLLMLFFTFLTSFVLFSGKIRACGCFGDCVPLTPVQTFTKDILLLLLVLLIFFKQQYINPLFTPIVNATLVFSTLLAIAGLQWFVLKHLPVKDCLPFKVGNNILELRKMPKDAVPDEYNYIFVYKKNGASKEFNVESLPDSSWEFTERKQVLVKKGKNNVPPIGDFTLTTATGTDSTEAVLSTPGEYYLLFVKEVTRFPQRWTEDQKLAVVAMEKGKKLIVVTSQRKNAEERYGSLAVAGKKLNIPILTCDATALKTAARNNVTLYHMNGPVVKNKWGGNDIEKALDK